MVYSLRDPLHPNIKTIKTRESVRVFPFDQKGRVAMVYYDGTDAFGRRQHYESIGGGIEFGESKTEALHREALEEGGFILGDIEEFEVVSDVYGLINQANTHFYYTAQIIGKRKSNPTLEECLMIDSIQFKRVETWIELLSKPALGVNLLVHQRELLMMQVLQNQLKKSQEMQK